LTSEKILGLPKLLTAEYTKPERKAIILELGIFALATNQSFSSEIINCWMQEFSNLNMKVMEVIKRIRLAKLEKKFGVSDFSVFMNLNTEDYSNYYKHERLNENYIDPEIERLNNEIKQIAN
jgi:hypothetical protein